MRCCGKSRPLPSAKTTRKLKVAKFALTVGIPIYNFATHPRLLNMSHQTRLESLQIVRALAAWAVVFHHYVQLYLEPKSVTGFAAFLWEFGGLGVDVFFVLSGFVMGLVARNRTKGPVLFLVDRVFKIVPAYWVATGLVVVCILALPGGHWNSGFTFNSLVRSLLFIPSYNPSGIGLYPVLTVGWTLIFEMFFYAALACCMAISRRWFLVIFLAVFAVLPIVYPVSAPFSVIVRDHRLYEFWVGVVLALVWMGPIGLKARHTPAISLPAAAMFVGLGLWLLLAHGSPTIFALSVVGLALVCEQHLRSEAWGVRWLTHLGDISYSTYLMHVLVIGIAIHFTGKNLSSMLLLATVLFTAVGTYLASWASHRWLENSAAIKQLKASVVQLIGRKKAAASTMVDLDDPLPTKD